MPAKLTQQTLCPGPELGFKELDGTGVVLPEVGVGTYLYRGSAELLRKGLELGATFIDTAELYQNEEVVGRAINGMREQVFIATKTHHFRYHDVIQCAEASLSRLGIDTIDLYQLHWPNAAVPINETMSAMEELVQQGKVRFIGLSNFTVPEFLRAQATLKKTKLVSNQVRYSLVDRTIERDLLSFYQRRKVTVIAYSSLGHNFRNMLAADPGGALDQVAREVHKTRAQVALNWCLVKPGVVVIPKTESEAHMIENCKASGWRLTPDQVAKLDRAIQFRCRSRLRVALRRFVRKTVQRVRGR
jgi:diketogulonate reductase-like aldo/keto reductase